MQRHQTPSEILQTQNSVQTPRLYESCRKTILHAPHWRIRSARLLFKRVRRSCYSFLQDCAKGNVLGGRSNKARKPLPRYSRVAISSRTALPLYRDVKCLPQSASYPENHGKNLPSLRNLDVPLRQIPRLPDDMDKEQATSGGEHPQRIPPDARDIIEQAHPASANASDLTIAVDG